MFCGDPSFPRRKPSHNRLARARVQLLSMLSSAFQFHVRVLLFYVRFAIAKCWLRITPQIPVHQSSLAHFKLKTLCQFARIFTTQILHSKLSVERNYYFFYIYLGSVYGWSTKEVSTIDMPTYFFRTSDRQIALRQQKAGIQGSTVRDQRK